MRWWLTLWTIGCNEVASGSLATHEMSATLEVKAWADGTSTATAYLRKGGVDSPTFVTLEGTDTLFVSARDQRQALVRKDDAYSVAFSDMDDEGIAYGFSLQRRQESAPSSGCVLPAPFVLQPLAGTLSRTHDPLVVQFSTSSAADVMRIALSGDCVRAVDRSVVSSAGSITLDTVASDTPEKTCAVTLRLQRIRGGTLDTAFGKGGTVTCIQERQTTFQSIP